MSLCRANLPCGAAELVRPVCLLAGTGRTWAAQPHPASTAHGGRFDLDGIFGQDVRVSDPPSIVEFLERLAVLAAAALVNSGETGFRVAGRPTLLMTRTQRL